MRRLSILVFILTLAFPVASTAATAAQDPDGVPVPATSSTSGGLSSPALPPWIDSIVRVVLLQLGL